MSKRGNQRRLVVARSGSSPRLQRPRSRARREIVSDDSNIVKESIPVRPCTDDRDVPCGNKIGTPTVWTVVRNSAKERDSDEHLRPSPSRSAGGILV